MKAAVINEKNNILVEDVQMPDISDGEALIKVRYCGVCGSDIHILRGNHPTARFPVIPGHEFVGELVRIEGDMPGQMKIGDMVVAQPFYSCGHCEPCTKGCDNVCENLMLMGAHINGGCAEYVKVLSRKMYKVPSDVEMDVAALTEPLAVAVYDVYKSRLRVGENALIIGGGPIGILTALVAKESGGKDIVIAELDNKRREFAQKIGLQTIDPSDYDTSIDKFNVVFETSGSNTGMMLAMKNVKNTGTIMIVGMSIKPCALNLSEVFSKEIRIQGVRIHNQYCYQTALKLLSDKSLVSKIRMLISKTYPLDNIQEAFRLAQAGSEFMKILIEI